MKTVRRLIFFIVSSAAILPLMSDSARADYWDRQARQSQRYWRRQARQADRYWDNRWDNRSYRRGYWGRSGYYGGWGRSRYGYGSNGGVYLGPFGVYW